VRLAITKIGNSCVVVQFFIVYDDGLVGSICRLQFLIVYDDLLGVVSGVLQFLIVYDDLLGVVSCVLQFLIVYDDLLVLTTASYNPYCLQSDARSASRIVTGAPHKSHARRA